jgi:hypothetical protein
LQSVAQGDIDDFDSFFQLVSSIGASARLCDDI